MMDQSFIEQLRQRLQAPLPGWQAQWRMASHRLVEPVSDAVQLKDRYKLPAQHKKAGVMALIYYKDGHWHTALMQRPPSQFVHGRQVSFPGGGKEAEDPDMSFTALRETEEEFGIPRQNIELLGGLTELYIPASNYLVHPFVGYLSEVPQFNPDPNEVAEVLQIPLPHLLDPQRRKTTDIEFPEGLLLKNIPYFDLENRIVWGATAMMLSELVAVLEEL